MGDLSKNFSRHEFKCRGKNCCDHSAPINPNLVIGLQQLHDALNVRIDVHCGFRCIKHNGEIPDSSETSRHTVADAADISSPNCTIQELYDAALKIPAFANGGIGKYSWGIHVDVRTTGRARW